MFSNHAPSVNQKQKTQSNLAPLFDYLYDNPLPDGVDVSLA